MPNLRVPSSVLEQAPMSREEVKTEKRQRSRAPKRPSWLPRTRVVRSS